MRGVYAIVDLGVLAAANSDPLTFALRVLEQKPAALQVRAKNNSAREILKLLKELAPVCKEAGVPLVMNDRVDLAIAAQCDMVHLGQDDLPIEAVRHMPTKSIGIGLSTHTLEQLDRALRSRPEYVAYGPIFATSSKENHEAVVGLNGLKNARATVRESEFPRTPLVAIGGITAENAGEVIRYADAIAVIGALVGDHVGERMRALQRAIGEKK